MCVCVVWGGSAVCGVCVCVVGVQCVWCVVWCVCECSVHRCAELVGLNVLQIMSNNAGGNEHMQSHKSYPCTKLTSLVFKSTIVMSYMYL